ncbi:MAG: hypothetical protein MJB57_15205 [Gemmatimonadetes bacterium]|nr:hypothetical protein [Gemmatimonadota bacterium]
MSESIERNTESGSEVDLERRGLLKKAWVAPLAVTLATLPADPLHGGTSTPPTI